MVVEEQAIATSKNTITSVMDLAACMCHFWKARFYLTAWR
jgi:hypothetical protein